MDKNPHHDKSQKGTENQKIIKELIKNLGNSDGVIRERARRKLVSIGPSAIDYLAELVYTKNEMLRWEAVKTLSEIVNPVAIPLLIDALEDDKSSIRWLAAEGLIMLGRESVKPLLEALVNRTDSVFIREGAHHFFHDLRNFLPELDLNELLRILKSSTAEHQLQLAAGDLLASLKAQKNFQTDKNR
jgi:HEAT repeat protein